MEQHAEFPQTYIDMVSAAEEVQDRRPEWRFKKDDWVYGKLQRTGAMAIICLDGVTNMHHVMTNPKWIPTRGQLVDLFGRHLKTLPESEGRPGRKREYDPGKEDGLEDLLDRYMAGHGKTWDGKQWVRAKGF